MTITAIFVHCVALIRSAGYPPGQSAQYLFGRADPLVRASAVRGQGPAQGRVVRKWSKNPF